MFSPVTLEIWKMGHILRREARRSTRPLLVSLSSESETDRPPLGAEVRSRDYDVVLVLHQDGDLPAAGGLEQPLQQLQRLCCQERELELRDRGGRPCVLTRALP